MKLQEVGHKRYSTEDRINHFAKLLSIVEGCQHCKSEFLNMIKEEGREPPPQGHNPNAANNANTHDAEQGISECYQ